jgi:hypothetical protein
MKSLKIGLMVLALVSAGRLMADDVKSDAKSDGKCSGACASEATCPVTEGMAKLPKIAYMVGEETLCCEEMAKEKAASTKAKLVYVVGTEKYESSDKAFVGLVEQTEKFVSDFATPVTCKVSGKTAIAGESLTCSVKAGEVASTLKKAMGKVAISYKVGDKTCSCPVEAKTLASQKNAKTLFVVDDEETECEHTARLNLAKAKYKAGLLAMLPEKDKVVQPVK